MRFAKWLRAALDELMRTPYVRLIERRLVADRELHDEMLQRHELMLQRQTDAHLRERQQFIERIRDKDAQIADLRVRLAVAETDGMREKLAKQAPRIRPVPEFDGPLSFQDELLQMNLKVEETISEKAKETA